MDGLSKACYCYASNNIIKSLCTNPTKCSNTLKQLVDNLPTNCLSVFDHLELELNKLSFVKKGQLFSNFCDQYFHYQNIYGTSKLKD